MGVFLWISGLTALTSPLAEEVKDAPLSTSAPPALTQSLAEARASNRCLRAQSSNGVLTALPQRALDALGGGLGRKPKGALNSPGSWWLQ